VIAQLHHAVAHQPLRRGPSQDASPERRGEPFGKQRYDVNRQHRAPAPRGTGRASPLRPPATSPPRTPATTRGDTPAAAPGRAAPPARAELRPPRTAPPWA